MTEEGAVAFRAERTAGVSGVFAWDDGGVTAVAETDGPWSRFHGLPVITGDGTVVFRADRKDGVQGIYAGRGGHVETVVESGDDRFESFGLFPSANANGTVAFVATLRSGGAGIFTVDEHGITQLVDTGGQFESFRGVLIPNAGDFVIAATPRGGSLGLFGGADPAADRILALEDPLLGSTVAEFAANPVSVNAAGQVAVRATLTDGRQLILRADP